MALSADEQKLLDQLEASLRADDPALARKFQVEPDEAATRRPWWVLGAGVGLGVVLLALGMLFLWPLSVVGFLVMFGSVIYVALKPSHPQGAASRPETADSPSSPW